MSRCKLLILAASPKNSTRRWLDEEIRDIQEGLQRARNRDNFVIAQRWAVRPRDFQRAILEESPQIIHFSGRHQDEEGLFLEDVLGNEQRISDAALASFFNLFAQKAKIECVVLSGCYCQAQATAIVEQVPYVIGIDKCVDDRATIDFSVGFYDALGNGELIPFAYEAGKVAMALNSSSPTGSPILLSGQRQRPYDTLPEKSSDLIVDISPSASLPKSNKYDKRSKVVRKLCIRSTAIVASITIVLLSLRPLLSNYYMQKGNSASYNKLGSAEQLYKTAIWIDKNNFEAHNFLGRVYEDSQDLAKAENQYKIARQGDLPAAYNNLGRLYLQTDRQNLTAAFAVLNKGIELSYDDEGAWEVRYSLHKNLGWLYFLKTKYSDAKAQLDIAIEISERSDVDLYDSGSAAHCLMAETLEEQQLQNASLQSWQRCCQLGGDANTPEEYQWMDQAKQKFAQIGRDYNKVCIYTAPPILLDS